MRKSVWLLLLLAVPAADSLPALQWNMHLWGRLRGARRAAPDVTQDIEYRRLVTHLPARGDIGLVQVNVRSPEAAGRVLYYLQYSLAPRRIVSSIDPEFVVVVGRPTPGSDPLAADGFRVVAAVDDELRVYRRITR